MKKIIIFGTVVLLTAIIVGIETGVNHPFLLLSSGETAYQIIRVAIIALLLALVFTAPPRSIYFRTLLGAFGFTLFVGPLAMLLNFQMGIIDAMLFNLVAIIFAIEAIEAPTLVESTPSQPAHMSV